MDRFEMYKVMSEVFFKRLSHAEKTDALLEVLFITKGDKNEP